MSQDVASKKSNKALFIGLGLGIGAVVLCCLAIASLAALAQFTDLLPALDTLFGPKWPSAKIIPHDTDFYMAADPNIKDMKNAKHLVEVYSEVLEMTEDSAEVEDALIKEYDISFQEDIRPWLGPEVALAIPNITESMENEEPAVALIAATIHKKDSDAFLAKLRENIEHDDYTVHAATYEGVDYYVQETESEWDTPAIFGRIKNFVVITTDENLMKEIIDTFKRGQDSLYANENYQQLLEALPEGAAAVAYYDMENFAEVLLAGTGTGVRPPEETMAQLEAFKATGAAMRLTDEGVAFDFVSTFDPEMLPGQRIGTIASEGRILERIPADALGFLSNQNLDAAWKKLWESLAQNPDFEQQLDDLGSSLPVTIDENLFSWVTGEYALAAVKPFSQDEYALPVNGYAIFEVSDQEKAETLMSDISGFAQLAFMAPLETEMIEGVEVQVLEQAGLTVGYGFPPQHMVLGFGEDALKAGVSEDILPISEDATFQTVIGHLPDRNRGYFYVNVKNAWKFAYDRMEEDDIEIFDADVRPYLEPLEAIGLASQVTDPEDGLTQGTMFFYIP